MDIEFVGHDIEISDHLKQKIRAKFEKIERHASRITRVQVFFSKEANQHSIKSLITLPGHHQIHAAEISNDLYTSVDALVVKLVRQLDNLH